MIPHPPSALALSTCWSNHRYSEGFDQAWEAKTMGFDWIEISHGTKVSLLPGLLRAVAEGVIRVSSMHAPCPSPVEVLMDAPDAYEFTSHREDDRRRAVTLTLATLEMAGRFGVDRVVLHLGSVPMKSGTHRLETLAKEGGLHGRSYVNHKLKMVTQREKASTFYLDRARSALDQLIPHAEKAGVRLGIETRSHFEQVPTADEMTALLEAYKDCAWIGAWHDFGHVQRQANLGFVDHAAYLHQIAPRLLGCHVHDVGWPERDHRIPGTTGGVDFPLLLPLVPPLAPLVWELSPRHKRLDIVAARESWLKKYSVPVTPPLTEAVP